MDKTFGIDGKELGAVIRAHRKKRGLSIENLADENISATTISNIERGLPSVGADKTEYLMKKLGISIEKLLQTAEEHEKKRQAARLRLLSVEMMLDRGELRKARHLLEQLQPEEESLLPEYYFVTGKCHCFLQNWKKAEEALFKAIEYIQQQGRERTNIEAAAYANLGQCGYQRGDLDQALDYADKGLKAFVEGGERGEYKYVLLHNKAVYLRERELWGPALNVVEEAWKDRDRIERTATLLGLYYLRADCLRKTNDFEGAFHTALEGLKRARISQHYLQAFNLWNLLGDLYKMKGEWAEAVHCYTMALDLKDETDDPVVVSSTYAELGRLYIQRGEWDRAFEYANKAAEIAERFENFPRLVNALKILGDYWRMRDRKKEAVSYYQRALELARRHQLRHQEYELLFHLARCWRGVDEEKFLNCLREMHIMKEKEGEIPRGGDFRDPIPRWWG